MVSEVRSLIKTANTVINKFISVWEMGSCITANVKKQGPRPSVDAAGQPALIVIPAIAVQVTVGKMQLYNHQSVVVSQTNQSDHHLLVTAVRGPSATKASGDVSRYEVPAPLRPPRHGGEIHALDLTADMNPAPKKKKISYLLNVNGIEYKVPLLEPVESSSLWRKRIEPNHIGLVVNAKENLQLASRMRGGSRSLSVNNFPCVARKL